MWMKKAGKAILDGLLHGTVLVAATDLVFFKFATGIFYIGALCVALCSVGSFLLLRKEKMPQLLAIGAGSVVMTVLTVFLLVVLRIEFGFAFFPIQQLPNAAGFMIIAVFRLYVFLSLVFRIVTWILVAAISKNEVAVSK